MVRPIVFLKLGGSLITDKSRPGVARQAVIQRLARDLASAARRPRGPRLILGHGSGSFGHAAAADGGLTPGADARRRVDAISLTQHRAAELHRLVVGALVQAGARPFSFSASSFLCAANGRLTARFVEPIFEALDRGLLPVVYGDVVIDRTRGAMIVSTEELFLLLAGEAAKRKLPVARAGWLGETDGVRDGDGRTIARLSAAAGGKMME
jgi:isopentenyl phosphate kinase